MNTSGMSAIVLALCTSVAAYAVAQGGSIAPAAAPVMQRSAGGIEYISGGAGEEDRATMTARQNDYTLKVVLSGTGGEYIVADKLSVATARGEVLLVRDAGPVLMMKLPPGDYGLDVAWQGKTAHRSVRVAATAQTTNWRLPD